MMEDLPLFSSANKTETAKFKSEGNMSASEVPSSAALKTSKYSMPYKRKREDEKGGSLGGLGPPDMKGGVVSLGKTANSNVTESKNKSKVIQSDKN